MRASLLVVFELRQPLELFFGGAGQRDLVASIVQRKAVVRHRDQTFAHTEEAADLDDRVDHLLLVYDKVVDLADRLACELTISLSNILLAR